METWIKYYADAFPWAHTEFKKLNEEYLKEIERAHKHLGKHQLENAKNEARRTGIRQKLTSERHLLIVQNIWKDKAHELARQQLDDNAALNKINPEIQRDEKPKKSYDHLQKKLDDKQDTMQEKIDAEKDRKNLEKAFEDDVAQKRMEFIESEGEKRPEIALLYALDAAEQTENEDRQYYQETLKDYFGYTDEKIKGSTELLRKMDEQDARQDLLDRLEEANNGNRQSDQIKTLCEIIKYQDDWDHQYQVQYVDPTVDGAVEVLYNHLHNRYGYDDDMIREGIKKLRELDQQDEKDARIRETQETLNEIFERKSKSRFTL